MPEHGDVTDGSKSEEMAGAGYQSRRDDKGTFISLRRYAIVFQTKVVVAPRGWRTSIQRAET